MSTTAASKYHMPDRDRTDGVGGGTPRKVGGQAATIASPPTTEFATFSPYSSKHSPSLLHQHSPYPHSQQQDDIIEPMTPLQLERSSDGGATLTKGLLAIPEKDSSSTSSRTTVLATADSTGHVAVSMHHADIGASPTTQKSHHPLINTDEQDEESLSSSMREDDDGGDYTHNTNNANCQKGKLLPPTASGPAGSSSRSPRRSIIGTHVSTLVRRSSTMHVPTPLLPSSTPSELDRNEEAPSGLFKPNTTWQLIWSTLIMLVSLYNTITVPYRMAFWELPMAMSPDTIFFIILDAIGDTMFFFEMYRNFRTGYIDNGVVIYDKHAIWLRYRNSWFFLDLTTCLPFDLLQCFIGELYPVVRVLKILRLFEVLHHYNNIEETATVVSLQFRVTKLLFYTGMLSHFGACIKYHVMLEDHVGTNPVRDALINKTAFGRYLQAMYWATGAMTGRDDTNPPENLFDAGFTVFMMVVGILWLAYIIASLETFAHDGNNNAARFQAKVGYVQQFMYQFQLPKEIQDKVKAYYSYLWSSTLRFETDRFLTTLPVTLQADVNLAIHRVIEQSEIFENVESGFLALVIQTISTIVSIPNEIICSVDRSSENNDMWFISEGEVEICIGPKLAAIAKLREGDFFGEYGILLNTTRTATARSVSYSTLLVLSSSSLLKALSLFPFSDKVVRAYVEEHRSKTLGQERNFLGLDRGAGGGGANGQNNMKNGRRGGNDKLKKLITVDSTIRSLDSTVWTVSPLSKLYERWQIMYFIIMGWNGIILPVRFGFLPTEVSPLIMTIDYLGDIFLICDILLKFRLRFIEGGEEIHDLKRIRDKYLRSGWFGLDFISSFPLDFIMIHVGMQPLYRLNRILRLAHVHTEILYKLKDTTHYEIMSLLYLIFNFLFLSHWAASIYYSFTRFEGFEPDIDYGPQLGHPNYSGWRPSSSVESGPIIYQYLQSQYYAMSLLAGIGRHLYPPTNVDVMLSLFVMLTGVFVVSYLIGKVGHLIFNLNASAAEFKAEQAYVTQLMDYRKVNPDVSNRVTEYMKHIWSSQKGIDPNIALRGLPLALRTDIMLFICADMIRRVPRFKDLDDNFVRQLVTELTFVELPASEYVFRQGQIGDSMYFISKGLVEILFDTPTAVNHHPTESRAGVESRSHGGHGGVMNVASTPSNANHVRQSLAFASATQQSESHQLKIIGAGSFFGEGALFSGTRAASIRARTPVRLLALSEVSFTKVMHVHPHFAEKIMYLNQERQKRMEAKVVTSNNPPIGVGSAAQLAAHLHALDLAPSPSGSGLMNHMTVPSAINGGGNTLGESPQIRPRGGGGRVKELMASSSLQRTDSNSPRARSNAALLRKIPPLLQQQKRAATGFAMQVEKLLAAEREKESSRRCATPSVSPMMRVNDGPSTAPTTPNPSGGKGSASSGATTTTTTTTLNASTSTVSAMATAATATSPAMASAASSTTSSHPVTSHGHGVSGSQQWNAHSNPPTLTITTTHTIALHDSDSTLGGPHHHHHHGGSTHIISDIHVDRQNSSTTTTTTNQQQQQQQPQQRTPSASPMNDERNMHAGFAPPGYSMDDDLAISPPQQHPVPVPSPNHVIRVRTPDRSSPDPTVPLISARSSPSSHQLADPAVPSPASPHLLQQRRIHLAPGSHDSNASESPRKNDSS